MSLHDSSVVNSAAFFTDRFKFVAMPQTAQANPRCAKLPPMKRTLFSSLFVSLLASPIAAAEEPETFNVQGQLDLWATIWDQDENPQADTAGYGDPEHDPGFTIRRARFGIWGAQGQIDYSFMVGVGAAYDSLFDVSRSVQLVDAYAGYRTDTSIGESHVAVGVAKVAFSREMMMSSADLVFTERGVGVAWLTPNRDAGVTASQDINVGGEDAALRLTAGVYNGNADIYFDTDPGLLTIARLEFEHGDAYRTWSDTTKVAFGLGLSGLINNEVATSTQSANLDFLARVGPLAFLGDATYSVIAPKDSTINTPAVPDVTKRLGMMMQVSASVEFGETRLEPAFRMATYDDATHIDDNGDVGIMHGGFTWHELLGGVDLGGAFIHRIEREGRNVSNDTIRLWARTAF